MGRPLEPARAATRNLFREWSERTFATYWRATKILTALEGREGCLAAIKQATRPNGSLNVAKLERLADTAIVRYTELESDPT
jgi:hypothetical protein